MTNFYKTYLNIIKQQAETTDDDLEKQLADTPQAKQTKQTKQTVQNSTEQTTLEDDSENNTKLKFSADLASQFGNTVNSFTHVAASIIKKRTIDKAESDKIYDLMGKIKDLLDAASKSV